MAAVKGSEQLLELPRRSCVCFQCIDLTSEKGGGSSMQCAEVELSTACELASSLSICGETLLCLRMKLESALHLYALSLPHSLSVSLFPSV